MNNMELQKQLAKDAQRKGICKKWYDELLSLRDKRAMVAMYLRGIDFCLSNDYPSNDFIRSHFKGVMETQGVFLDDAVEVANEAKCVCLGKCTGKIVTTGYNVCEIFVKHDSCINIYAHDNAFVVVDCFDNSVVNVVADGSAKVCVNQYAESRVDKYIDNDAVVKVRVKNKKSY